MRPTVRLRYLAAAALVALVWAPLIHAQKSGSRKQQMPRYDRKSETTVKGTVQEVIEHVTNPTESTGVLERHGTLVTVKTDGESTMKVFLGPSLFLNTRNFKVEQGTEIEVRGSKVNFEGSDVVLAREAKVGTQTLTLRNPRGRPLWGKQAARAT